uniref:Uncharacterized protein n=1 Tax=Nothobranchius rachovii TaxID=451742 RepID=A0A1A8Q5K0_9TELE
MLLEPSAPIETLRRCVPISVTPFLPKVTRKLSVSRLPASSVRTKRMQKQEMSRRSDLITHVKASRTCNPLNENQSQRWTRFVARERGEDEPFVPDQQLFA